MEHWKKSPITDYSSNRRELLDVTEFYDKVGKNLKPLNESLLGASLG